MQVRDAGSAVIQLAIAPNVPLVVNSGPAIAKRLNEGSITSRARQGETPHVSTDRSLVGLVNASACPPILGAPHGERRGLAAPSDTKTWYGKDGTSVTNFASHSSWL